MEQHCADDIDPQPPYVVPYGERRKRSRCKPQAMDTAILSEEAMQLFLSVSAGILHSQSHTQEVTSTEPVAQHNMKKTLILNLIL